MSYRHRSTLGNISCNWHLNPSLPFHLELAFKWKNGLYGRKQTASLFESLLHDLILERSNIKDGVHFSTALVTDRSDLLKRQTNDHFILIYCFLLLFPIIGHLLIHSFLHSFMEFIHLPFHTRITIFKIWNGFTRKLLEIDWPLKPGISHNLTSFPNKQIVSSLYI